MLLFPLCMSIIFNFIAADYSDQLIAGNETSHPRKGVTLLTLATNLN